MGNLVIHDRSVNTGSILVIPCGRSGHIAEACKSKSAKVHKVDEPEPPQGTSASDSIDPFSFSLYNLCTAKNGIEIQVQLNGVNLFMELDTGAGVSIISQETFNKHFTGTPLKPSSTRLHTYTGHPVQVTGQFHVHLKYQDQSATLPLLVVEGSGPSLFGRDWLTQVKLDWKKICSIHVSDSDLSQAATLQFSPTPMCFSLAWEQSRASPLS